MNTFFNDICFRTVDFALGPRLKGAPKSTIEIKSEYFTLGGGQLKILPRVPKIVWAALYTVETVNVKIFIFNRILDIFIFANGNM